MNETQVRAMSRFYNKKWLGKNKADLVLGSLIDTRPTDTEKQCFKCGRKIYLMDPLEENSDLYKKSAKLVCPYCLLILEKENKVYIEKEMKDIIERAIVQSKHKMEQRKKMLGYGVD